MTLDELFERCIPEPNTGCWLWLGRLSTNGYVRLCINGVTAPGHRHSYEIKHGVRLPRSVDACHRCDIRSCINPDHVFPGSRSENMQDCARKGRNILQRYPERAYFYTERAKLTVPRGETQGSAKLTTAIVLEIRRMSAEGVSSARMATMFNIHAAHIRKVASGKAWAHVRGPS